MAALNNAFKSYLDENRFWSYRETLFETIAVLWISTSISAELVKRYFPDWRASRMDLDAESPSLLWRVLGYGQDRCFWDRALSFWKVPNISACQNDSDIFPVLTDTEITIGYMGMYATLTGTALLYLLFFYSLFINKSVRLPIGQWTVPAFHQVEKLLKICGRQPKDCKLLDPQAEPSVKRCTDGCFYVQDHEYTKCSCRVLGRTILILVLCVLCAIPAMVIGFSIGLLMWAIIILWTVVWLMPVVVLATGVARAASVLLGEDAVFPCYIALALVLVVYSAGRLAGIWMRSSYLLWICSATKKTKTIDGASSIKPATSFDTVVEPRSLFAVSKILGYLLAMYAFAVSIDVKLEYLSFSRLWINAPSGINETNPTNGTDANFNGTKKLCYWSAIESYWVKNSTLYDYTIIPEPSSLEETVGSFCSSWTSVLVCLLITYQIFGIFLFFYHEHVVGNIRKRHDSNPTNKRYPKWYTYVYDGPRRARCWCACTLWNVLTYTILETPLFAIMVLPFPILNVLVPEQYHFPGLIVMSTACAVGAMTTTVQLLLGHRRGYKRYPHDPLGQKLSCGEHPLCGNYRKKSKKHQEESFAEKGSAAEEEPILEVAVKGPGDVHHKP